MTGLSVVYGPTQSCLTGENHSGDSWAVSGTDDWGLWQINRSSHKRRFESMFGVPFEEGAKNAELNSRYALFLIRDQGFGPWSCWP